ncbi:MAG: AmmeMemoRadiSam system protein B [Treponema sp. GWB1_62_6]|nr:MAG: AmmeMemoRadiSam system protein B [Treponema sp. GWA1_62_8]OHE62973.1 MAG: AmmeMemoRadiSam system protein B [Treponema sp. GWB1_62_6]OHE66353.1 MAG: AmmeMemoRadiSam system protein B [Treponema sp. GWC1_61_84]OHE69712.1 MAG: AmmeMemoRadiSam system protein B [Treponema sp. RIFOXYC1_FULL_61_9]HCM26789.1 AmmeMemoRadiSam system protein B [Treponema sp.]
MTIRKRLLPVGWYPSSPSAVRAELDAMTAGLTRSDALACVCPHAGWTFSGRIAAMAISALRSDAETVIIFGGHLGPGARPLLSMEDVFETPVGVAEADAELRGALSSAFEFLPDRNADNTVEIQLPLAVRLFPRARLLCLRLPADMRSAAIGAELAKFARSLGRRAVAVGSTDLTHYGPNYDFMPAGDGPAALEWTSEVNDKRFIDALLEGDPEIALERANSELSACSPGAAVGALAFARENGAGRARKLGYATSADVHPSDSFVGYAAIGWFGS